ncbi:hypothetical protein FQZ97_635100 [compost metagenome]
MGTRPVSIGGASTSARRRSSAAAAATAATSIRKPRRDGPPATAKGIDDSSTIMCASPVRSRCALRLGR